MTELENILTNAREDILALRRERDILRAKVEVMDLFACVLHTEPAYKPETMGEDVVWKLDKVIRELQTKGGDSNG